VSHAPTAAGHHDGKFADVLENTKHRLHPRAEFEAPADFEDEELLVQRCQELNCVLAGASALAREERRARFPLSEVVARLRAMREVSDRALQFWDGEEETEREGQDVFRLLKAIERAMRWIMNDGEASGYDVAVRCVVYNWLFFPHLTGARSQVELLRGLGMKDKQQFNRLLIECSESFGYRNPTMREQEAVESFREAAKRRTDWEEFLHGCVSNAMMRVNEARGAVARKGAAV
jgi:hypothetical protein